MVVEEPDAALAVAAVDYAAQTKITEQAAEIQALREEVTSLQVQLEEERMHSASLSGVLS